LEAKLQKVQVHRYNADSRIRGTDFKTRLLAGSELIRYSLLCLGDLLHPAMRWKAVAV